MTATSRADHESPAGTSPRFLVPALMLACMIAAIVSSLGAPLIPSIARTDHVSLSQAQWSLTITLLVAAVATPVMGRLGDGRYRRRVILATLALIVAGGALAALPLGFGALIAGRGLQGLGLGLTPLAIATAREALPASKVEHSVGMLSTTAVVGVGLGYPVTGLLARAGGIHAAYGFGAVVSLAALLVTVRYVPRPSSTVRAPLDVTGAVLVGAGLAGLVLGLSEGATWGWSSPRLIAILVAAAVLLALWAGWELRADRPLVALRLLAERPVLTASATALLAGTGIYLLTSSVTRYIQTPAATGYGLGGSVLTAGLVLLPFSAAGYLISRSMRRILTVLTHETVLLLSAVLLFGTLLMFTLARASLWEIVVMMTVNGIGVGAIFAVIPGYILRTVPPDQTASAISFNQVLRYLGYCIGSALSAMILQIHTPAHAALPTNSGYTVSGAVGCAIWLLTALAITVIPRFRSSAARPGPHPLRLSGGGGGRESNPPATRSAVHRF
jgi:predicted MFS family arabinose efflux permease